MNFQLLAALDVWALTASVYSRRDQFSKDGIIRRIEVRTRIEHGWHHHHELDKWGSMRNVLAKLRKLPIAAELEMGDVTLEMLPAGASTPWEQRPGIAVTHLPLVSNPNASIMCGVQAQHLPVGALALVNYGVWVSEVNWGDWPRIHLVVEWNRMDEAEVEPAQA